MDIGRSNFFSCKIMANLLQRQFEAKEQNKKWVTDVTQYRVGDTWLYLSVIKDIFNNEIVAYQTSWNSFILSKYPKLYWKLLPRLPK